MKIASLTCVVAAIIAFVPFHAVEAAKGKKYKSRSQTTAKSKPLRVIVGGKRYRGSYSYQSSGTIDASDTRRFTDPSVTRQSPGGPFDNGFFFETPNGPFGGYTPYWN